MKIRNVKSAIISVPFKTPIQVSTTTFTKRNAVIVEIETDEGITGMGYIGVLGRGSEAVKTCLDYDMADLLVGENPLYRNKLWEKMWWATNWFGRKGLALYALSAVDIALWDIAGKVQHSSLHTMLGPYTDSVKAYASAGFLALSTEELVNEALSYIDQGFRAYKMKVGSPNLREDLLVVQDTTGAGCANRYSENFPVLRNSRLERVNNIGHERLL